MTKTRNVTRYMTEPSTHQWGGRPTTDYIKSLL